MKIQLTNHRQAFTVFELVVVVTVILVLLAVFLPSRAAHRHNHYINCVNNLKEVGIAFRIWEGDNNDKYPMDVAVTNGGAQEWVAAGNVAGCFQVMSNELATSKLLICPEDLKHDCATNFETITSANLSYFVGLSTSDLTSQLPLSGDANLIRQGNLVPAGRLNLLTNTVGWAPDRHQGLGNVLFCDGSVQTIKQIGETNTPAPYVATNEVVIP